VLTIFTVKSAFSLITICVKRRRPFWFVTQDKSFYRYSRYLALKCGEFSSTLYWIRGMASNFDIITAGYFITRPKFVYMRKDFLFELNYSEWFFTRLAHPGGMLLSSVFFSNFAVRDALKGYVGCLGLLDTNANAKDCSYVIPSNDDSIDWVVFINDVFSEYILFKKFWAVLKWYYFIIKKPVVYPFFENWVSFNSRSKLIADKLQFSKKFGQFSIFYFPLWYISSFNNGFAPIINKLNVNFLNFNIKFSKIIFKNLFDNLIIKQKLVLGFNTKAFYGRVLFFMNDGITFFLGEDNWEMALPYVFKYTLYNNWTMRKKYSSFIRRYQRSTAFYVRYINNVRLLFGFGIKYLYQKFALNFRNNSVRKLNFLENLFIFNRFVFLILRWFAFKKRRFRKKFEAYASNFSSKNFFFWDSLEDKYLDRKLRVNNNKLYLFNHFKSCKRELLGCDVKLNHWFYFYKFSEPKY